MDYVHPLRVAYIKEIRKQYKGFLRGDDNPALSEKQAMKIQRLGLSYAAYMTVAVKLNAGTAKFLGWKYPYYNAVIGDKTIDKVKKMLNYTSDLANDNDARETDLFEQELIYATEYIEWWFGRGERPSRGEIDVPVSVKSAVAEYICRLRGIPYTSSNYNVICKALENLDGR